MTQKNQVYRCNVCGNMVVIVRNGAGQLVCCGQPMELLEENSVDASKEKHVPVITKEGDKVKVQVGSVLHPMEEKHFIEWIELIVNGIPCRHFLKPGDNPIVEAHAKEGAVIEARAYCNIHGLWKAIV
ncbi:MAG: desulfoferrodoxin [Patescibacteria group bacterium]|jgi:superoxide reductase